MSNSQLSPGARALAAAQQVVRAEIETRLFDLQGYLLYQSNVSFILDIPVCSCCCGPYLDGAVRLLSRLIEPRSVGEERLPWHQQNNTDDTSVHHCIRSWIDHVCHLGNVSFALAWHVEGDRDVHLEYCGYDNKDAALRGLAQTLIEDFAEYIDLMLPEVVARP
jgi:hypothetical protein